MKDFASQENGIINNANTDKEDISNNISSTGSQDKDNLNDNLKDDIKEEDKKYIKKYIMFSLVCFFGGGLMGLCTAFLSDNISNLHNFTVRLSGIIVNITPYAMAVDMIAPTIIIFFLYCKYRKMYNKWDSQDEDIYFKIENGLSYMIIVLNTQLIIYYILIAIMSGNIFETEYGPVALAFAIIGFIGFIVSVSVIQQKIINFEKELNPEKKGSIFDLNFHEKWMQSCDEAEKLQIYKASWSAYKAVNVTCLVLLALCVVGMLIFDIGILPVIIVGIVWSVLTLSYAIATLQFTGKRGSVC